jgi:hypothetical protein
MWRCIDRQLRVLKSKTTRRNSELGDTREGSYVSRRHKLEGRKRRDLGRHTTSERGRIERRQRASS